MKRLHLANIANMAYNYASILRYFGHHSDVLCYDLDHWLSDPSSNIGFTEYPPWYKKTKTMDYLKSVRSKNEGLSVEWLEALQRYSARYAELSYDEIAAYKDYVNAYAETCFQNYDVIYGYAYGAIPPVLYAERKFIPVDLGSLRGLSGRTDSFSRVLKFSLSVAPHVIVTNPDVVTDCVALGLDRYTFIPHPIDETFWVPSQDNEEQKSKLKKELEADFIILAPARHDWGVKGNDEIIRGVAQFAVTSQLKIRCLLIEWGEDINRSKALIKTLGAEHVFEWRPLLAETQLKDLYSAANAMIDQLGEALTFGLSTPKAMSTGIPVLTRFDYPTHEWCYAEMPPLLPISDSTSISEQLHKLAANSVFAKTVVRDQRQWIETYHSKEVVSNLFLDVENQALSSFDACRVYFSLNQKKHEIVYEEKYSTIYDEKYHDATAYQMMDQLLVDWMQKHLVHIKEPRILDLGCGPGSMIPYLKQISHSEIHGVDISPTFIQMARQRFPDVEFKVGDAEIIPYEDASFDVVLCSGMLHHIPDLNRVFDEIGRVLKPDGFMFAREPNEDNFAARFPGASFVHLVLKHLLHIKQRRVAIVEPDEHEFHIDFDSKTFVDLLAAKFDVIDCTYGQRVSYFYDMLFDGRVKEGLETFERELDAIPGLNILVACKPAQASPGVSVAVSETLARVADRSEAIPIDHFRSIAHFARQQLELNDQYISAVLGYAGNPGNLFNDIGKLGHSGVFKLTDTQCKENPELSADPQRPGFPTRVSRLLRWNSFLPGFKGSLFRWGARDYAGNLLYDTGIIDIVGRGLSLNRLGEVLQSFRDYSLILLKINAEYVLDGSAISALAKEQLSHSYVLAEAPYGGNYLLAISKKLFTVENLKSSLLATAPPELSEELAAEFEPFEAAASTRFFSNNLFHRLSIGR